MPHDLSGTESIDESGRIDLANPFLDLPNVVSAGHGIDEVVPIVFVTALSVKDRGAVVGHVMDPRADLLRFVGDDEEGHFLVVPVHQMQDLCGRVLEDDGIERLIRAKKVTADQEQHHIESEDQIPGFHAVHLREVDRDKIRAAAGSVRPKAQTDRKAVDDAAENTDQENVLGQRIGGNQVGEKAGQHDHDEGEQGELLPDKAKSDIDRDRVESRSFASRWIRIVMPVAPPGIRPPVCTSVRMFSAMIKAATQTMSSLLPSFTGSI